MMRSIISSFITLLVFCVGTPTAIAQEAPTVSEWVEKMAECTAKPLSYDFSLNFNMAAVGTSVKASGSIVMLDQRHMHMTTKSSVESAMMPNGAQKAEQVMIMDGETMWTVTSMDHPVNQGEKISSVSRMTIELMEKMGQGAAGMGGGLPGAGSSADMATQIRTMFDKFYTDCELSVKNGTVKISGNISDEFLENVPMGGIELDRFRAELDQKTAFPNRLVMGNEKEDIIEMSMSNAKFLDPKKIDKKLFEYVPDPGIHVMDMDAMLNSMVPAGADSSESDF
ncbi:MAG: hypothetical protein QF524_02175 [Planctomycetota bacterium]|jgi:hypothetical protein|nr:hypothetical protein [Planctomycetota bacterium]